MKADILLFKPSNIIGKIISKVSNSEYSHVALCISDYDKIIESTWRGNKERKLTKSDNVDAFRYIGMTEYLAEKIVQTAITKVNLKYDWSLLLTIMLNKWFGMKVLDNKNRFICSEFIDNVFKANGIDIIMNVSSDNVTPAEFGIVLNNSNKFEKY